MSTITQYSQLYSRTQREVTLSAAGSHFPRIRNILRTILMALIIAREIIRNCDCTLCNKTGVPGAMPGGQPACRCAVEQEESKMKDPTKLSRRDLLATSVALGVCPGMHAQVRRGIPAE